MTKTLAKELAGKGVTVNAIAPGFINTDMTAVLTDEIKATILNSVPLKRMGTVDDIAAAVSFLAGEAASYITGQVLVIDGGLVM
jgi:3-oxoacyl-[acyl-carrier protein] reductase